MTRNGIEGERTGTISVKRRWIAVVSGWVAVLFLAVSGAGAQDVDASPRHAIAKLRTAHANDMRQVSKIYLRELRKLNAAYRTRGDTAAELQVQKLLEDLEGGPDFRVLCGIRLETGKHVPVRKLKEGEKRFSGAGDSPTVERVAKELVGADFTQPPPLAEAIYEGSVAKSGYLYLIGTGSVTVDGKPREVEPVYRKIEGQNIEPEMVGRIRLRAGEKFRCAGTQMALVAGQIATD